MGKFYVGKARFRQPKARLDWTGYPGSHMNTIIKYAGKHQLDKNSSQQFYLGIPGYQAPYEQALTSQSRTLTLHTIIRCTK